MSRHLNLIVSAIFSILPISTFGQNSKGNGIAIGRIIDSINTLSLGEAAVSVLTLSDSSLIAFGIADTQGRFEIKNLSYGSFRLLITFQGYHPINSMIHLSFAKPIANLGNIHMQRKFSTLQEVIVEAPAITMRNDTVEFNISFFKVKPNASAEDLLKKLPGIQVDKAGNIKVLGENIQALYVDGKHFFSNDPKLAAKNITADMIESVQIYDDMSEQAKFTRVDDGSRQKTINLKLKKDKRDGYFGRGMLGYGPGDRNDNGINFNRFNYNQRISILATANNLNKPGYSFNDVLAAIGGLGNMAKGLIESDGGSISLDGFGANGNFRMSSGNGSGEVFNNSAGINGIMKSLSAGMNYNDNWGSMLDVNGSYFFSKTDVRREQVTVRQSFFPYDSSAIQNEISWVESENSHHRFNFRVEYYADSMNSFVANTSLSVRDSWYNNSDTISAFAMNPGTFYRNHHGKINQDVAQDGLSLSSTVLYRRRMKRVGRTFTLGWNNVVSHSDEFRQSFSRLNYYNPYGIPGSILIQDLNSRQDTKANTNIFTVSYTEPVQSGKIIEFNYGYTNLNNESDRKTFDFNSLSGEYDQLNLQQSNYFENEFKAHKIGINFRSQGRQLTFQFGGSLQKSQLTSRMPNGSAGKDSTLAESFTSFVPTASVHYQFRRNKNLRIHYRGRTNPPSVHKLQPVPDYSNPLLVTQGNPSLHQEFRNTLTLNYNSFNLENFTMTMAGVNVSKPYNEIVNSVDTIGHLGIQKITPVNMNGSFSVFSYLVFVVPFKDKLKGSSLNANTSLGYNKDLSVLNKFENTTNNLAIGQSVGLHLDFRNKINASLTGGIVYNRVSNSINARFNDVYFIKTLAAEINCVPGERWVFDAELDYNRTSGRANGFNRNIFVLNSSVTRWIFRKKNGDLKLSVNDIFNQKISIGRTVGENYTEDIRSTQLGRYFLFSFIYRFNKSGSQQGAPGLPPRLQRQTEKLRISH